MPSDALVLIGKGPASLGNLRRGMSADPVGWKFVSEDVIEVVPGTQSAVTKEKFADFQLHVEWQVPDDARLLDRWGGNSGIIPITGRRYEVQILDSWASDPAKPKPVLNYPDGLAGAVYGQNAPSVNAARKVGEWQTYEIVFHAGLWEKGSLVKPATVSVLHNGVLVQDEWPLQERTPPPANDERAGFLEIQNHNQVVRFRNVWIRRLVPRWANTTHGGPFAREEDVRNQREKTAAELFAELGTDGVPSAQRVDQALEIICYSRKAEYLAAVDREERRYLAALAKMDEKTLDAQSYGIRRLKRVYAELVDKGVLETGRPMQLKCDELIKERHFAGHVYYW